MAGSHHSSTILVHSFLYVFMVFFTLTALPAHHISQFNVFGFTDLIYYTEFLTFYLILIVSTMIYICSLGDFLCCDSVHFRVRNDYTYNYKVSKKDSEAHSLHMFICKSKTCFLEEIQILINDYN